MAHDYAADLDGTMLDTLVDWYRFVDPIGGAKRGRDQILPGSMGRQFLPDKRIDANSILLEVGLPAAATGDSREALSLLAEIFSAQGGVTLKQTDPYLGAVQALVELARKPTPSQNRLVYLYRLNNPSGLWEDQSASNAASANPPVVTTGGDSEVDDAILTFAGPGFLEHTDDLGVLSRITIDAAAGAGTYIVDLSRPRTVEKSSVDQSRFVTVSKGHWMKFQPNKAQSFTSDVAVEVDWRDKWA